MTLLAEIRFDLELAPDGYDLEWLAEWKGVRLDLCYSGVRRCYDLPKGTKTIWIRVHDKPRPEGVHTKIVGETFVGNFWDFEYWYPPFRRYARGQMSRSFEKLLNELTDKNEVWLEAVYI